MKMSSEELRSCSACIDDDVGLSADRVWYLKLRTLFGGYGGCRRARVVLQQLLQCVLCCCRLCTVRFGL